LDLLRDRGLRTASEVVSNGVDLARFSPGPAQDVLRRRYQLPAGQPVILSVGRLSGEKRLDVLLAAARRLTRPATLVIAGTGAQESLLRRRAAQHNQAGKVVFTGHVPDADLPGLYRLADVFAIASESELQSLAAMEAMATGLPVVAADACALPELVRHDRNGFLFPPGRADLLAGYLDLLVADPQLRDRMSAESLRIAGRHARSDTLARWEALYRMLAGSAAANGGVAR
jgi:glycosyltransferase involved in cell wall biosynthesis